MRRIAVLALVLSQLTLGAAAFAQETTPTDGTTSTTTTATVTTPPPAITPPATSTTTTTQAALDVVPPVAPPPLTESSATETTTFVNRPLLVTGILLFGGTYAASAGVAAESARPSDNPKLYYPVVGPWMDLGQRDCATARPCVGETGNKALLILDGVTQDIGALAVLTSFFVPEKRSRHWFVVGSAKVHAEPVSVGSGYGLAAVGRFQ